MTAPMIEVESLVKTFGKGDDAVKAVTGIDFSVPEGEIFGLLGANGAGKSTVVLMLATLLEPTSGKARVAGHDVVAEPTKARLSFGAALQETGLDPLQKGGELLKLHARLYGYDKAGAERRTNELLDVVGLQDARDRRIGAYSGGMRRRLDLAAALIHHPKILFLDEPTTGLDPQARRSLWEVIRKVNREGTTVFLTTHYMEEAQSLCQRVAVVDGGRIIALNSPDALIHQSFRETAIEFDQKGAKAPEGTFRNLKGVTRPAVRENGHVTIYTDNAALTLGGLTDLAEAGVLRFDDLHLRRATLEDVFLKLTGKRIRE